MLVKMIDDIELSPCRGTIKAVIDLLCFAFQFSFDITYSATYKPDNIFWLDM